MRLHLIFRGLLRLLASSCFFASMIFALSQAQQAPEKHAEKKPEKAVQPEKSENPYQIELLESSYRFEANGDSRKEVHTRVCINNELGVRQFARLDFDYNRSFESIEIPLVHIRHPSGGTADILPSAITDNPNPAVVNAPAYQDVRIKSVRILGLEPGDVLEYRIVTTTTHQPLAPDFWLDHSFDHSGIVSREIFELDLPDNQKSQMRINAETPAAYTTSSGEKDRPRKLYRWERAVQSMQTTSPETRASEPDISVTTFVSWRAMGERLMALWKDSGVMGPTVEEKAVELTKGIPDSERKLRVLYDFVSRDIETVNLPLGASGFRTASPSGILSSGFGTPFDKLRLLDQLSYGTTVGGLHPTFLGAEKPLSDQLPMPSLLVAVVGASFVGSPASQAPNGNWEVCDHCGNIYWLDPALAVAPFGMLRSDERGKMALFVGSFPGEWPAKESTWRRIPNELPFASIQRVNVDATLNADGKLAAKVHYSMRGDNELVLRLAFHQSPKDKWKELAQLLSISDGFRGQVTTVTASDPYATKEPFTVDYEITQPKFVDWSKKPVRIPALLPQLGLPDPPAKPAPGAAPSPVELGTPLEVETHMILHLPSGTTIAPPTSTSVQRDYATFASQYSVKGLTVSASRHINFLLRQVPADRTADYNAFLHAVQSDQAQLFTLDRESTPEPATKPASSTATSPPASKSP